MEAAACKGVIPGGSISFCGLAVRGLCDKCETIVVVIPSCLSVSELLLGASSSGEVT